MNVLDDHAPVKHKYLTHKQSPFMNGDLRRAINVKAMLQRKYLKNKSSKQWQIYKRQRNHVTKEKIHENIF